MGTRNSVPEGRPGRPLARRAVVAGAAASLLATMFSLAGGASAQAARVPAKSGGVLNIMGFGTNGDDVAQTRLKLAEAAIAPTKINAPNGGFSDESFLADIASGNVPDLVYMNNYDVGTYAAKGALLPMTSCLKSQGVNMDVFTSAAQAMATYDGQVYGLPEFTDDRTLIVVNSVLQKAGVPISDVSTTNWTNLYVLAKKLTSYSDGKLQTIGFDPKLPEFFPLWVKANGGAILSPNGLKAELDSKQDIKALTFANSIIQEEGGYSNFITYRNTWNYFGSPSPFSLGQIGITPFENWMYNVIASDTPTVKVTAVPFTDRTGKVIDYETGSVWVIPKGSKNPTAACKFAATMTKASTWEAAAANRIKIYGPKHEYFTGLLTGNHVADTAIIKLAESSPSVVGPFMQAVKETYAVESGSFTVPDSPASEAVNNAWSQAVTSVLEGTMTPTAALQQAQQQAQLAIDQARI